MLTRLYFLSLHRSLPSPRSYSPFPLSRCLSPSRWPPEAGATGRRLSRRLATTIPHPLPPPCPVSPSVTHKLCSFPLFFVSRCLPPCSPSLLATHDRLAPSVPYGSGYSAPTVHRRRSPSVRLGGATPAAYLLYSLPLFYLLCFAG